jgi:hypothetical protein
VILFCDEGIGILQLLVSGGDNLIDDRSQRVFESSHPGFHRCGEGFEFVGISLFNLLDCGVNGGMNLVGLIDVAFFHLLDCGVNGGLNVVECVNSDGLCNRSIDHMRFLWEGRECRSCNVVFDFHRWSACPGVATSSFNSAGVEAAIVGGVNDGVGE